MPIWHRLAKHSILILGGIIKKISYECRDYESVGYVPKNYKRKISGSNGLKAHRGRVVSVPVASIIDQGSIPDKNRWHFINRKNTSI